MNENNTCGFIEGLTVVDRQSGVAYLYYDISLYLYVDIEASEYIVHTPYNFPCSHIEIVPAMGDRFVIPIEHLDDQNFSFKLPWTGPFYFGPD